MSLPSLTQAKKTLDWTKTPRGPLVLHAPANCEMCKVRCLQMKTFRTILYGWMPLGWLLEPGTFTHPSTHGETAVPYYPKSYVQCKKNYHGINRGHPGPLPGLLSPRRAGIINPHPNRQYGWELSTGRRRRHTCGPRAHQDCHPWKRHVSVHQERQKQFKLRMTNMQPNCFLIGQ